MSKQLAISSCVSIFAMACLMVLSTEDRAPMSSDDALIPVQVELTDIGIPTPGLLP
jgi:hypothetical protein